MTGARVLVVDDEPTVRDVVARYLERDGYQVRELDRADTVAASIEQFHPDLIILDIMLPGGSGLDVLRRTGRSVPVILLTARVDETDRVLGLELGADDYVCKPFSPRELVARIKTILRRVQRAGGVPDSALVIDSTAYTATLRGQRLDLTPVEFRLLSALAAAPGRILSRASLLEQIYDDHRIVTDRTVDTHVKNLRRKMEQASPGTDLIHSVYGVGYRLDA